MKTYLFRSSAGIDHWMIEDGNETRFAATADVTPILEQNKKMATHNDGYTADRTMRRQAQVPYWVMLKWWNEEGWWFWDPNAVHKVAQKLNDAEWQWLRTAPGRVGVSNGVMR